MKNELVEMQNFGRRKLMMLNKSQTITDLRISPSKRPEKARRKSCRCTAENDDNRR